MIARVVVFAVAAISCAVALPFGNCGQWDAPLGNLIQGQGNIIPGGINFPAAAAAAGPIVEAGAGFPGCFPSGLVGPSVSGNVVPLPAPTVQAPLLQIQRVQQQTLPVQNIQLPNFQSAPILPTGPIVHNIEARIPTAITRLPTIHTRIPPLDAGLPPFPSVPTQIFPGQNIGQAPFAPCSI